MIFIQNRSRIEVLHLFFDLNHERMVITTLPWGQWVTMGFNVQTRLLMQTVALIRPCVLLSPPIANKASTFDRYHKAALLFALPP